MCVTAARCAGEVACNQVWEAGTSVAQEGGKQRGQWLQSRGMAGKAGVMRGFVRLQRSMAYKLR